MRNTVNMLQEWSIPLIAGVFVALLVANAAPHAYHTLVHEPIPAWFSGPVASDGHGPDTPAPAESDAHAPADHHTDAAAEDAHPQGFSRFLTMHFLINDIFMVFFFGLAAKEIVESFLPGGALNPIKNAVNPLLGTIGGVLGPIGVFFLLNLTIGAPEWTRGWGIPTATDIALAWLVARIVFGAGHPAISFLLLLAVADDAIGLGIIAFGYPDPLKPTVWLNTWWIIPGMVAALAFRLLGIRQWWPYILVGGAFTWWGLHSAGLHPALALVPIVPFLPAGKRDIGMFADDPDYEAQEKQGHTHSSLQAFEHQTKLPVDFGLFFFAFANAGVEFAMLNNLTWIIFLALLIGKMSGITAFSFVGMKLGFPLPKGMATKHLFVASIVAGIGLTVALFVAGQAFKVNLDSQAAAKMGALFSGFIAIVALVAGRTFGVKDHAQPGDEAAPAAHATGNSPA